MSNQCRELKFVFNAACPVLGSCLNSRSQEKSLFIKSFLIMSFASDMLVFAYKIKLFNLEN